MLPRNRRPTHPGEILKHEFMEPMGLTQQKLAEAVGITRVRINEIVRGKRGVTPDTAFRLARYFGTTAEFWLNLQRNTDMWDTLQTHQTDYDRIKSVVEAIGQEG
ncbi:MAG: HigA family addiction module antitoxin [Syntrophobacteraceae bacterium]|jgi:addiction module HigA family antidote